MPAACADTDKVLESIWLLPGVGYRGRDPALGGSQLGAVGRLSPGYQSEQGLPLYPYHGGVKGMFRFVALMWNAESPEASVRAADLEQRIKATAPSWEVAFEKRGILILVADRSACFGMHKFCDDSGVVVGEVFARLKHLDSEIPAHEARFNRLETWQALKTQGRSLASDYWGNFVALMVDDGSFGNGRIGGGPHGIYIFKDPCGTLPCHFTQCRDVGLVFSSLEDCRLIGMSFQVNWAFVRERAVHGILETEVPTLLGVSSVHRGQCVKFDKFGKFVSR